LRKGSYITRFEEKVRAEGEILLKAVLNKKEDTYGTPKNIPNAVGGLLFVAQTQRRLTGPC
jgi:hypothetical protein